MKPIYAPFIYRFLSLAQRFTEEDLRGKKILDCGAGGPKPQLGLFAEQGLDAYGIDIDTERLAMAKSFAVEQGLTMDLREGDMRQIPFDDAEFDLVYEFYAMCHLRKREALAAIEEMQRVLKPGGLLFLGFMSADTWPLTGTPNEFNEWKQEEGGEEVVHTVYFDEEGYDFVVGMEILFTEKERRLLYRALEKQTKEAWMAEHQESWFYDREEWESMYDERLAEANYSHRFFLLKKTG